MVDTTKIKINGLEYTINSILKNDRNFVELKSFEQAGFTVAYDAEKKQPILSIK